MTEATQGNPTAATSTGAHHPGIVGTQPVSQAYTTYTTKGAGGLLQHLNSSRSAYAPSWKQELGFGTDHCILEAAVKSGDERTVELLCKRFSASVLQRTLHLNSAGESLLEQAIQCNAEQNPAIALEILGKLCETCVRECAKSGQTFGVVANDLIASLLAVTKQSSSNIKSWSADQSWQYSPPVCDSDLKQAQQQRSEQSEKYRKEAQDAYEKAYRVQAHGASQTSADRTQTTASHAQPSPTQHNAEAHDKRGSPSEQTTAEESGSGEALQSTSQTEEVATTGSTHGAQTESMTGASVATSHTDTGAQHVATEPSVTALAQGVDSAQTAEGANTEKDNERDVAVKTDVQPGEAHSNNAVSVSKQDASDGVSYVATEDETAVEGATYDRDESESGLSQDEVEQLHTSTGVDLEASSTVVSEATESATPETAPAKGGAATRTQQAAPKKVKAAARQGNGGRFPRTTHATHVSRHSDDHKVSGAGAHNSFLQFAEKTKNDVETVVVELEAQTLPEGASALLETISKILQDIGTQVKNAKDKVSSVAADAAALQTLLEKVIDLLNNLVNTMRDLLAKLGGVASDQSRKLGDISRQVANKVQEFGAKSAPAKRAGAPSDSDDMAPAAKRRGSAPTAYAALLDKILTAAEQGKLADALQQHVDALSDPKTLHSVLSHRNAASLNALDLCVAKPQNVGDITAAIRVLMKPGNQALGAVLAHHLTQAEGRQNQSIIQRIIGVAASSESAGPSVVSSAIKLVTCLIGELCPSSGDVGQRLLAGHVARSALQAGSADIFSHAMTVGAVPGSNLVHNPIQDAIVASAVTWIENRQCTIGSDQDARAIKAVMSLLQSCGKVSPSAAQEIVARCSVASTAALVYKVACECNVIDPSAKCSAGTQAYVTRYELARAMSALYTAAANVGGPNSAGLRACVEDLLRHINTILTAVSALTGRQWISAAVQLVPRTQTITEKIQHVCDSIAAGTTPSPNVESTTQISEDAQQILQMIRDVANKHPAQRIVHTLQTFNARAVPSEDRNLVSAYERLRAALESAHDAYKGPFHEISIENFANSLNDAAKDIISAIDPVGGHGGTLRLELRSATRKIVDSISDNPHLVFCSQKVAEELLHAAALLELATKREVLSEREGFATDRTAHELVNSFREKATNAYYHITRAYRLVEEHGTALREHGGESVALALDKLRNAGNHVKQAAESVSYNVRVTAALEAEALLDYCKNALLSLVSLGEKPRDSEALQHLQRAARVVYEHIVDALVFLRLAAQILKDIVVHAIKVASGNARVTAHSLNNPESSLLDVMPAICARIGDADTALARSNNGADYSKLREALRSAHSVLLEIGAALPSGNYDFLDGNAPHLILHACAREISRHNLQGQLGNRMREVLTDLESVVGRLVDINALNTLEQSPAVEVPEEFVRSSLKTLAYTLQVRSAAAGVRALVPGNRLAEIAGMLPVSDGKVVITSGADLAVALRALIEEHNITHVRNAANRDDPIVVLSEISRAIGRSAAARGAQEAGSATDDVVTAVPVQFVYNALVACSNAMQLSTAIDGVKARIPGDMLNEVMVAGLPNDARQSRMVSDASVISTMIDNLIRLHKGLMHQDAVYTAHNAHNRGCLDLVREVIDQKITFDLGQAVPASVYSTEPRAAFIGGVVEQALIMPDSEFLGAQAESRYGEGERTVTVNTDVAHGIVVAAMHAIQEVVIHDSRRRTIPPSLPSDAVRRIVSEAASASGNTMGLSAQMVSGAFQRFRDEMVQVGALAQDTTIWDELVRRVVSVVMHTAARYTGSDASVRGHSVPFRHVEKMVTSIYIDTQKEHCRSAIRAALKGVQDVDQDLVKEAAKYATTLVICGGSANKVPRSSCVSLAWKIASTLSEGDGTVRHTIAQGVFSLVANCREHVVVSEQFFVNLFTTIRDSVKRAHAAASAGASKAPIAVAFAELTDEMIQNLAQGVIKIHSVAQEFWENGTVVEESSKVSEREAEQRATTAANSVDGVPFGLARTVLIATISAVVESVAREEHLGAAHIKEHQIETLVESKLKQQASSDGTLKITSDLVSGMLTELNSVIQQTASSTGMSNRAQISEDLHPAIARIAVSAIRAGKTTGNSISKTLLDRVQHDIHAACGTAITAPAVHSRLARAAAPLVLDLATVFAGLNDAKGVMEELITGSNSSNLTEGQKERIQFAIGAAESLMERISTRGIRDGAERIQDDIRLVVSTIAGMHRDGNLAPSDQCAISAAYGALVAQLGLVEAARTSENVKIVPGYGYKGFAPRMVEVGHAAMDAGQQKPHLSSDTEGGVEPDKTITHLNRTARLLKSINQFLVHSGIYNTLQGGKLLHHLRAVRHQLEIAQQAALFTLLTKVAGGRDTESVVPHERALQEAITRSQECLLNAKLVAAPLSKDAVSMLSGLSDAVTLLQETSQQRFASQPQRILGEDWASQIFRMVSIARSAADSAQKEQVAASAISHDKIAARNRALMHLGAVENLVGFLYDARIQRDARLVEQVLSHLEQCKNNLRAAQLVHRRDAARAEGAQRDAVQHYSAFVQVAMHAVHMAHDLICEHVRETSHNILDGWRATASSLGGAQPDPQEVRQRAAALIDVYEAARDAGMLVSKVCMETRNNVFVPRKSAAQVLCESAYASGSRIIGAPRHQEVEHELTILVGDALSAKALLNQVCTKLADHEDGGIVRLMGNIEYATDAMLNRDRGIAASKEVVQLSNRIAALTKSGLAKLATAAQAANSPAVSATDLVRVSGGATPAQTQESSASAGRTLTAAQWFKTIVDVSSHVPEVISKPAKPAAPDTGLQEKITGASQDLSQVVQLLYGYGLNNELDTAQKGVVNALNSAVGLLPLLTGTGGYSIPDSLHPNTVNVVYRLGSSDIPQGNIGALAARFEVITHKLSLLMSLGDLKSVAKRLADIQDSDANLYQAKTQFDSIVSNVTALVKSVVQQIENAAPVRSLEASNAEGNRVVLQELRSVAVGALTRSYEQRGLQGLRESIKSVRESIGQQFVVVDSTLLQNMFSLRDVDSAEVLCSEAALPPEHDRVEKVIATIADALRTGRIDPVRTLSCLDRVLKNSVALGTLHTDETGAYALCEADVTDMLMAFYEHNDEDGIRFLRGKCGAYTIDSSRIESAVLARLGNNASLNTADTLLLDSYQQDIFTDPDVSIRQCQKVGASFLEIHLDRAYGQRGIHRKGSMRKDGIVAARRRQPADRRAASLTTKLFQKMPKVGEDTQPWYSKVWQWIIYVVNWCHSVARTAVMLLLSKGGKAQASLQQQEARQADISSARSADAGSGKGAPGDGHDHGADDKPKTSPLSAVAVRRSSEAHKMGEEAQQPWYMRLWQWVKDAVTSFVQKFLYPIFTRIVGSKAENRFVETAEPGKRAAQEVQQERSNDRNVAKGEESHRGGASETVEATKSEVAEEHSSPESENHEERLRAADGDAHLKNRKQGAGGKWLEAEDVPSSTITDPEVEEVSAVQSRRGSVQQ
ncbi:hypothetical protein AM712 [Anaplasma marginale str. St. Maries]|uniref:hypothetical protein n=1 Tax=Anaplasma marginale TaxID=770 RepID=UPI0000497C1B|nr:hypothetical protein [Anaplasma marginale]AAV86676.1 hypothetical protein AM712 [Anaplasma marginale str. St. Maries]